VTLRAKLLLVLHLRRGNTQFRQLAASSEYFFTIANVRKIHCDRVLRTITPCSHCIREATARLTLTFTLWLNILGKWTTQPPVYDCPSRASTYCLGRVYDQWRLCNPLRLERSFKSFRSKSIVQSSYGCVDNMYYPIHQRQRYECGRSSNTCSTSWSRKRKRRRYLFDSNT